MKYVGKYVTLQDFAHAEDQTMHSLQHTSSRTVTVTITFVIAVTKIETATLMNNHIKNYMGNCCAT